MELIPLLAQLEGKGMVLLYGALGVAGFVFAILVLNFGMIWVRAWTSGAKVTFTELIALKLRSVPVGTIVDTRIMAVKSGIPLSIDDLSNYYLAGGNIEDVARALIAAKKAGIHLDFDRACAITLEIAEAELVINVTY